MQSFYFAVNDLKLSQRWSASAVPPLLKRLCEYTSKAHEFGIELLFIINSVMQID